MGFGRYILGFHLEYLMKRLPCQHIGLKRILLFLDLLGWVDTVKRSESDLLLFMFIVKNSIFLTIKNLLIELLFAGKAFSL